MTEGRIRPAARVLPATLIGLLAGGVNAAPAEPPTEVAAGVTNRRLLVSWNTVAGATGYTVAVRPADGIVPFAWTEYAVADSPYTVAELRAMSGQSYEVRVAAVAEGAEGGGSWSPAVTVTAPPLPPGPAGEIAIRAPDPYAVGDIVQAARFGPGTRFVNRSWLWTACRPGGSDCRTLPRQRQTSAYYEIGDAARGKLLRVQLDYERDGVPYSVTADLGVVGDAPRPDPPPSPPASVARASRACPEGPAEASGAARQRTGSAAGETIETHLHALTSTPIRFGSVLDDGEGAGGAIDALCDDLLVVTSWGKLLLVSGDEARLLDGQVPMSSAARDVRPRAEALIPAELEMRLRRRFNPDNFRVADVLLDPQGPNRWRLFVTHHYADAESLRFRLSSTEIRRDGRRVIVSPAWTAVLDIETGLDRASEMSGGRMLTDGPDRLLVVVGDHATPGLSQDIDSHLGKLIRVDVATGRTQVLARGLRNPQGLARETEGTLWGTDHGPHGGDELNVLETGGDYGWPSVSHGVRYNSRILNVTDGAAGAAAGRHDGFSSPVFFWTPAVGIGSVIVNNPRSFPLWGNDLLVGSLLARAVFRVRRDGTDVKSVERIDVAQMRAGGIRDMVQMPDGRIALLDGRGTVLFWSRSRSHCNERFEPGHVWSLHCPPVEADAALRGW